MMLPNFFIVGAPKAGTTSAYHYLAQHPGVFLSAVKEPNFFSSKSIASQGLYYPDPVIEDPQDYQALFAGSENFEAVGEASVSYLFYEEACQRISATCPNAKILIFLRNPAERAFSHFLMDQRLGFVDASLSAVVQRAASGDSRMRLHYQQYVELGLYAAQLERYRAAFGDASLLVTFFEDLQGDPVKACQRIFGFLGVDASFRPDTAVRQNPYRRPRGAIAAKLYKNAHLRALARSLVPEKGLRVVREAMTPASKPPELDPDLRAQLSALFRNDVMRVERFCSRRLDSWRDE